MDEQKKFIGHLTEEQYYQPFNEPVVDQQNKKKLELALDRAWKNRDFEIDKYWSRATYFWAFIAATFAGYISVLSSDKIEPQFKNEFAFIIICLGVIFSLAWVMVNLGSKKWQENWEKHIDMLEDYVTGPIYKTVLNQSNYSVSRINILVSKFVLAIWIFLASIQGLILSFKGFFKDFRALEFDHVIFLSFVLTIYFIYKMLTTCVEIKKKNTNTFSFNRRPKHFSES